MSSYNNYLHFLSVLFQGRKDGWFIPTKLATNLSISLSDTSTRKQVTQFLLYYTSSFVLDIWTWTVFYLSIYVISGLAYLSGQKYFTLHKSTKDIELCFWFLVSSFCCKESIGYFCGLLKMWKVYLWFYNFIIYRVLLSWRQTSGCMRIQHRSCTVRYYVSLQGLFSGKTFCII